MDETSVVWFSIVNCNFHTVSKGLSVRLHTVIVFVGAGLLLKRQKERGGVACGSVQVKTADSSPPGTAEGLFGNADKT